MVEASSTPGDALITTEVHRGAAVVRCSGEVDMTSAGALRETIGDLLGRRPAALLIDLTGVRFFGSTGISALVAAQEQADAGGVPLVVVATTRPVLRPLQVTTVDRILTLHPSVDEALDAVVPVRAAAIKA
jgi:anti-anti-sigma factor